MSEGTERVGALEIIGTVTQQRGTLVTEGHMSLGYLRVGIGAHHVVFQYVGVDEVDAVINDRLATTLPRSGHGSQQSKDKQA